MLLKGAYHKEILAAANRFNINPVLIEALILQEQRNPGRWGIGGLTWKSLGLTGLTFTTEGDQSIGVGEIQISTAQKVQQALLMPSLSRRDTAMALTHDDINILYIGAILAYNRQQFQQAQMPYTDSDMMVAYWWGVAGYIQAKRNKRDALGAGSYLFGAKWSFFAGAQDYYWLVKAQDPFKGQRSPEADRQPIQTGPCGRRCAPRESHDPDSNQTSTSAGSSEQSTDRQESPLRRGGPQ